MSYRLQVPPGRPARWGAIVAVGILLLGMAWWSSRGVAKSSPDAPPLPAPAAQQGSLDLAAWDFATDGTVPLDGDWQFFWGQLLDPEDFQAEPRLRATGLLTVPGAWNGYLVGGNPLPGTGYATFRLRVELPEQFPPLAMQIPYASTAYRLLINGEEVAANGVVGTEPKSARPQYRPVLVPIPVKDGTLDVLMQVSNFDHRRGGIWHSLRLGPHAQLMRQETRAIITQVLVLGFMLFLGLYHLSLLQLRRQASATLYFGLFCLLIAVRLLTTGELVLMRLVPTFPWHVLLAGEYMSAALAIPMCCLLLATIYPTEFPRRALRLFIAVGVLLAVATIVLPMGIRSQLVLVDQVALVGTGIYALYVIVQATRRKYDLAWLLLLGTVILLLATLNDVFYHHKAFSAATPLVPLALVPLVLIQSYILARQYSAAFAELEAMTDQNVRLAQRAQQHLEELRSARALLTAQDERLRKTVAEFLHSRVQTKLHLIWHKIKQAEEDMTHRPDQARESLQWAREQVDHVREEDIRLASHRLHPSAVSVSLMAALEELAEEYHQYFAIAIQATPEISRLDAPSHNQIPEPVRLTAHRVIAEALQNAAFHSGATTVHITLELVPQGQLAVTVRDNGRGFDTATMEAGLGLRSIAARIVECGGTWNLHSTPGAGTSYTMTIPLRDPYSSG